jgi:uncharacterized protein (DUF58 family)
VTVKTGAELDHATIRAQVRGLELSAIRAVKQLTAGSYRSAFRGKGVEFSEIREYGPGDDVRAIDWNVTARLGRPHIKRFTEEREQTLMFLIDASASTMFGAKRETAAVLFSALALAAATNGDEAGLIVFTSEVEQYVPPAKGIVHVERLIRDLVTLRPRNSGTNLTAAFEFLKKVRRKRSFVFLLTDFLASDFERELRLCARRNELIALSISDPREHELPDCGLIEIEDSESGALSLIDSSDAKVRQAFSTMARQRREGLHKMLRSAGADHLAIQAGVDFFPDLARFLQAHARNN